MKAEAAVTALSALAHESRLEAFRLLVKASPDGIQAGEIASQLRVPAPTLSFHLGQLVGAGLIESRRDGRSVFYSLRVGGIRSLLEFITQDCCQGRPELCAPDAVVGRTCGSGK